MTLKNAREGIQYIVDAIDTHDEELDSFLFSLGCFSGEGITVVKHRRCGCTVSIKDARYSIDTALANSITVKER